MRGEIQSSQKTKNQTRKATMTQTQDEHVLVEKSKSWRNEMGKWRRFCVTPSSSRYTLLLPDLLLVIQRVHYSRRSTHSGRSNASFQFSTSDPSYGQKRSHFSNGMRLPALIYALRLVCCSSRHERPSSTSISNDSGGIQSSSGM